MALFAAVDGQPRSHAPPTLREPGIQRRGPTTDDTPAGIAVTRRRRIGEAVHSGQVNMGQTQQAGAEWIGRRSSTEAANPLRSTGRPFPSSGPPDLGPGQHGRLKATPSRSRAMASILAWASVPRPTRHISMNPLGFVTLSPTGRPRNRYSQRFSPSPSANSSRNKIVGLRGPPLRSGPRKRGCSSGFRTGFFRVPEGNTLT